MAASASSHSPQPPQSERGTPPSFSTAFRFWLLLGFISFGGPTGQIAVMHAELVEKRKWIDEKRFLHALNFCMLLPGPEAQQLATYIGWLLHGVRGGLVAGGLFVLPSAIILWALSWIYVEHGDVPWIAAIFSGLKPAVIAIVASAVIRIGKRVLHGPVLPAIAAAAFVLLFFARAPFPAIVLGAGVVGLIAGGSRRWERWFAMKGGHGTDEETLIEVAQGQATVGHVAKVLAVGAAVWFAPILVLAWWLGWSHVLPQEGLFFSKAAMVTFGGAYAVLPYVAQQAVETHHWLTAVDMLNGLGLAETTPGPLIMVLQFVGFMGGWNHAAPLSPLAGATLGAAITTWATFVPCFIWIFAFAPWVERVRRVRALRSALAAITAAVVGVVLNLAIWFAIQVLAPEGDWRQVDFFALAIATIAIFALQTAKANVVAVVGFGAAAGLARWVVTVF